MDEIKTADSRRVINDKWGFCKQVFKNLYAQNPPPPGKPRALPHFFDYVQPWANSTNSDTQRQSFFYYHQWLNCLMDLGDESHPTCRKARWYFEKTTPAKWVEDWDDLRENGATTAFMIQQKLKIVNSVYQPFKVLRPGAYEYMFVTGKAWADPEAAGYIGER